MTEKEKRELEDLAERMPTWAKHLKDFRERHPEMLQKEIMKRAGFTFRMKKGKLWHAYWDPIVQKVIDEHQ